MISHSATPNISLKYEVAILSYEHKKKVVHQRLRVLKDSFYNKTTDRRTITAKGSLV